MHLLTHYVRGAQFQSWRVAFGDFLVHRHLVCVINSFHLVCWSRKIAGLLLSRIVVMHLVLVVRIWLQVESGRFYLFICINALFFFAAM